MEFKKNLIKVDKYGTKVYESQRHCIHCGGAGGFQAWPGYTCFRCGGSGIDPKPEITKEYTPERRAQLDAINERRRKKKHDEFLATIPKRNEEYRKKHGLNGEYIYVPKGNTYEIKDKLKEEGFHFVRGIGWYRSEPNELESYKVKVADLLYNVNEGLMRLKEEEDLKAVLEELKREDNPNSSEYIGEIGQRIDFTLKKNYIKHINGYYGECILYNMSDENENIVIYIGSVDLEFDEHDVTTVRATVKKHESYEGVKQTYINRPKVV